MHLRAQVRCHIHSADATPAPRRQHVGSCWAHAITRAHSSVARAADCRSAGPWLNSGCALHAAWGARSRPPATRCHARCGAMRTRRRATCVTCAAGRPSAWFSLSCSSPLSLSLLLSLSLSLSLRLLSAPSLSLSRFLSLSLSRSLSLAARVVIWQGPWSLSSHIWWRALCLMALT